MTRIIDTNCCDSPRVSKRSAVGAGISTQEETNVGAKPTRGGGTSKIDDSPLQSPTKRRRYMRRGSRCPSMLMMVELQKNDELQQKHTSLSATVEEALRTLSS